MKLKPKEDLENVGYTECEFGDCCDVCDIPEGITFAVGYVNDMCGEEVDHYICHKCASLNYEERKNGSKVSEHILK